MLREKPAVPVEIFDGKLTFAINRLVKFFHNLRASGFYFRIVRIHRIDEHGRVLSLLAELRRACVAGSRA